MSPVVGVAVPAAVVVVVAAVPAVVAVVVAAVVVAVVVAEFEFDVAVSVVVTGASEAPSRQQSDGSCENDRVNPIHSVPPEKISACRTIGRDFASPAAQSREIRDIASWLKMLFHHEKIGYDAPTWMCEVRRVSEVSIL
jgi:hypothetical protein